MKIYNSLKNILIFNFLIATILPILIIGLIILHIMTVSMEKEIANKNFMLAKSLAGEVERFLQEPLGILKQIKDVTEGTELLETYQINTYLNSIVHNYRFFEMLMILDHTGRISQTAPYKDDWIMLDMSGQDFFQAAQKTASPYWSPTFISIQSGDPTLTLSLPMLNGVIAGYLNLTALNTVIAKIQIGSCGYAVIADKDGTFIAHQNKTFVSQRTNADYFYRIQHRTSEREGTSEDKSQGVPILVSTAVVPQTGWIVGIIQPVEEAFSSVRSIRNIISTGTSAAVLLAVLIAVISLEKTLKPLSRLAEHSKKIAQGHYSLVSQEKYYREIDELTKNFNIMTEAVKARETAFQKNEERFRAIADYGHDWETWTDTDGKIIWTNPAVERVTGYAFEEYINLPDRFSHIIVEEDLERIRFHFQKGLNEKSGNDISFRIQRKDGSVRWVSVSYQPIYAADGTHIGLRSSIRDISDRKQAEEELQRLQSLFSNIVNSMPSVLIGVDADEKITHWNQQAEKFTGISSDEARGRILKDMVPQLSEKTENISEIIRARQPRKHEKIPFQLHNEIRYQDITVYPLITDSIEGAVIRIDDVTERVRMEEMMIQTEKMMSVGGLAAGMAHEINNPLAGILQGIQNVFRRISPEVLKNKEIAQKYGTDLNTIYNYLNDREILIFLEGIRESGERAAKIVANMLNFSRRTESRITLTNLAELLDRAVELAAHDYDLKKKYDFRHIEIVREYETDVLAVRCTATEIEQVVLNLLRNSAQAMAQKSLFPNSSPETRNSQDLEGFRNLQGLSQIIIRLKKDGNMAQIEVEDNGPGMDETTRKRVFEPFFTTKRVGDGTGLGLSVSYFIITNNHSGTMTVKSDPGKGTKFIIQLPL